MSELEFAQAMVSALQTALLAHAQGNPLKLSYSIGNRSMQFANGADVRKELQYWRTEVSRLSAAEAVAAGLPDPRNRYIRLNRP